MDKRANFIRINKKVTWQEIQSSIQFMKNLWEYMGANSYTQTND